MTSSKKKILYIHHASGMGGAPTSMLNIIRNLDKNKFDPKILFIFENPSICKICDEENINYRVLKGFFFSRIYRINVFSDAAESSWTYKLRLYPIIRDLISWFVVSFYFSKKILRQENADIIHFNSMFLTDWLWGARNIKVKKVVHIREPLASRGIGLKRFFYRYILGRYSDCIFAISKDNKERLNLGNKIKVIYNFMAIPPKCDEKEKSSQLHVIYLGGDDKIKGYDVILKSLKLLNRDIVINVAGHVNDIAKLESFPNVRYIGIIEDVYYHLSNADILIFPSIFPHFAKPIIEAGMCKLPVIASNVSGMEEILKDKINGLLIQPNNPIALANAINYLSENTDLRIEYGNKNYQFSKDKFSIESNMPLIEKEYLIS